MNPKHAGLGKVTDKLTNRLDSFEKLKQVANKNNYPFKLKKLFERLSEEFDFWSRKGESPKLDDITKDLNFVLDQVAQEVVDRVRVDQLIQKYPIN